jgi:polar amino acid transport system substrate-binding protein
MKLGERSMKSTRCFALLAAFALVQPTTVWADYSEGPRQLLATGKLRVGLNLGNRLTYAVGTDIGRDLARRLGAEVVFVEYPTPGAVTAGVEKDWDLAFIAADPAREDRIAFTPAYLKLDVTYLVRGDSTLRSVADADRAGIRIATGATAAYTFVLKRQIKNATLVIARSSEDVKSLEAGSVDAVTGLRDALLRTAARVPGSRVLPDNFTHAQQAVAVPKANAGSLAYLVTYLGELKKSGFISTSIEKTGAIGASVAY